MKELPPRYNFNEVEDKWCKDWEEKNLFHAQANSQKKSYTIVIPPPNVTGILHMGHALNNTLQDIIIRYKRMKGFETLWMPGTDHAGIATQNVVEKELAKEGKTRQDVGREEFLKRLWEWKNQYGDTIIHQLKKLGASCDWPRTRFTMDAPYSEAVKEVFVQLHEKGLIYQGNYIINWCPRCQTALSDEEAEHRETQGALYYIRYPFEDNAQEYILVATTRPETMLGDTAVAVNPKDKRYKKFIGRTLVLPLMNREIRVIADDFVDPKFGTGAVKVTPAHDPNDFALGKRHNLEFINIMEPDGRLNENAKKFEGMDRFKARKAVIKTLQEQNFFEKIEQHTHSVGHCYRCDTVVEPYLSKQWFVKMPPLAKPALKAVKTGKIKFYPKRWTKVYLNWMEDVHDWCISRQIWWGHRIPVWYCKEEKTAECKAPIVARTTPAKCPHCHSTNLKQDEDVLDTWFSSWLWPFATLGWPKKNKDLEFFYPGSSLFTASEIIFFWVARMIVAGIEFMDDIPFKDVYIHGTVRDTQGRKMSKSLGNAIDPLEIIKEYGADALRFSLIINSGQDLFISKEKFEIGRNFANKIWNATRLILINVKDIDYSFKLENVSLKNLDKLPVKWIISQFYSTLQQVEEAIKEYRYSEAETLIQDFFWGNFCDHYLEIIKKYWEDKTIQNITLRILENSLKMIHPFMPFVTEEIWHCLPTNKNQTSLCIEPWPTIEKKLIEKKLSRQMQPIIDGLKNFRNIRKEHQGAIEGTYFSASEPNDVEILKENLEILKNLTLDNATVSDSLPHISNMVVVTSGTSSCGVVYTYVDIEGEKQRLQAQLAQLTKSFDDLSSRLKNENFLKKAPAEVVDKERVRLESMQNKIKELNETIKNLNEPRKSS